MGGRFRGGSGWRGAFGGEAVVFECEEEEEEEEEKGGLGTPMTSSTPTLLTSRRPPSNSLYR